MDKVVLAHRRGSACFLKTPLASNVDPLKGAAKPGGFDALVTAAAAEEEEGNGQEGGDATGARKAAAALSALVLERGEAGPCTFLGVEGTSALCHLRFLYHRRRLRLAPRAVLQPRVTL